MFSLHLKIKDFNKKNWKEGKLKTKQVWNDDIVITKFDSNFQLLPLDNTGISFGNFRKVGKIKKINDGFELRTLNSKILSYSDDFWMVIGKNSSSRVKLVQGDTFQVYGSVMILKKISGFTDNCVTNFEKSILDPGCSLYRSKIERTSGASITSNPDILQCNESFCRICLETSDVPEDPFIKPCMCSGSMGMVHLNCFDQWIGSKFQVSQKGFYTELIWENIICENCLFKIQEDYTFASSNYNIFSRFTTTSKFVMIWKPPVLGYNKNVLFLVNCEEISQFFIGKNYEFSQAELKNSLKILVNDSELLADNRKELISFSVLVQKTSHLNIGSRQKFLNGSSIIEVSVSKSFQWKNFFCSCLDRKL